MRIYWNIDTRQFQRSIINSRVVTQIDGKRGDTERVEMVPVSERNELAVIEGSVTEMVFVAKESHSPLAPPLLWADEFTFDAATGEWRAPLKGDQSAIDQMLLVADSVNLLCELTYTTDVTGTKTSATVKFRISNDLWKGWESGEPPPLPSSDEWLDDRAVRHDKPQNLDETHKAQGRANIDAVSTNDPRLDAGSVPAEPLPHAPSHALGGSDPITPASIGAQGEDDDIAGARVLLSSIQAPADLPIQPDAWLAVHDGAIPPARQQRLSFGDLWGWVLGKLGSAPPTTSAADPDELIVLQPTAKRITLSNFKVWVTGVINAMPGFSGSKKFSGQVELDGQSLITANSALNRLLADTRYVSLTGNQTIAGGKEFTGQLEAPNQLHQSPNSLVTFRLIDNTYVHLDGNESIGGTKTFTGQMEAPNQAPSTSNSVLTVGTASASFVSLSSNQTVNGNKTFTGQTELTGQASQSPNSAMTVGMADLKFVHLAGNELIAGNKTFSGQMEAPGQQAIGPASLLTKSLADSSFVNTTGAQSVAGSKTLTGQTEMPNQVAATPNSAMTRGLADARYPTTPANDARYVMVTGAQTVAGAKTFTGQMQLTTQAAQDANSALTMGLADARYITLAATDLRYVALTGAQTVAGSKTFSGQMQLTNQSALDSMSALTVGLADARYPSLAVSDARYVDRATNQTVAGAKTFTAQTELTNQSATTANSALTRGLADVRFVGLAGAQTVAGNKTFSGQIELTNQSADAPTSVLTVGLADARYPSQASADNRYVALTGAQTVAGAKTFTGQMELNNQAASTANSAMSRTLSDIRYVSLTAPQIVEGAKTFSAQVELSNQLPSGPNSALTLGIGDARYISLVVTDAKYVSLTAAQTVAGAKTFSSQMELTAQTAATPKSALTVALGEARFVALAGDQIVDGAKTFTGQMELTNQVIVGADSALTVGLADARYPSAEVFDTRYVSLTDPQTVAGAKVFNAQIQLTNQNHLDDDSALTVGLADARYTTADDSDSRYVSLTEAQDVAGAKDFKDQVQLDNQQAVDANSALTAGMGDALYVSLTSDQVVNGDKTLYGQLELPNQINLSADSALTVGMGDARYALAGEVSVGEFVDLTSDQTIAGVKEFVTHVLIPGNTVATNPDSALSVRMGDERYAAVDAVPVGEFVDLTTNQSIYGEKTFFNQMDLPGQSLMNSNSALTWNMGDQLYVSLFVDQQIQGEKTFENQLEATGQIMLGGSTVLTAGLADARYALAGEVPVGDFVDLTTDQSIWGKKTFEEQMEAKNQTATGPKSVINREVGDIRYAPLTSAIVINVKTFGAIGDGIANDTVACQNAITAAAASSVTRTVYFPPGSYRVNLVLPQMVKLLGPNASMDQTTAGPGLPNNSICTLIPATEAQPVIFMDVLNGQSIEDLDITGKSLITSLRGVVIAHPTAFTGRGFAMTRVRLSYFAVGLWLEKLDCVVLTQVSFNYCATGLQTAQYCYGVTLLGCASGFCTSSAILLNTCDGLAVIGGLWGECSCPVLKTLGAGTVSWRNTLIHKVDNSHMIEIEHTRIDIEGNRIDWGGNGYAALVRQIGTGSVRIGTNRVSNGIAVSETGAYLGWETHLLPPTWPTVDPSMNLALRTVTDSGYQVDRSVDTSQRRNYDPNLDIVITDEFLGGSTTSGHIGDTGWSLFMNGSGSCDKWAAIGTGQLGAVDLKTGVVTANNTRISNDSGTAPSMAGIAHYSYAPWEIVCEFSIINLTSCVVAIGFTGASQSGGIPNYIVGMTYSSLQPSNFMFRSRENSVDTYITDSGIAGNTGLNTLRMRCLGSGVIRLSLNNSAEVYFPNIYTGQLSFAFWVHTLGAAERALRVDYFRWRMRNINRALNY